MWHSYFGFNSKQKEETKINKVFIIIYLLLQISITKIPKLNTKIMYTKKFNNDGIKQFLKSSTLIISQ